MSKISQYFTFVYDPGTFPIKHFTAVVNSALWYAEAVFLVVCDPSMNELWAT